MAWPTAHARMPSNSDRGHLAGARGVLLARGGRFGDLLEEHRPDRVDRGLRRKVARPSLFHRTDQHRHRGVVTRCVVGEVVAQRRHPARQDLGAGGFGVLGEERGHLGVGCGVAGGCRVVEQLGDLVGQNRNHVRSQRYSAAVGVRRREDLDDAVESADLAPTLGQPAEPVAEGAARRHREHVVPAAGNVGAGRLVRRRVEVPAQHLGQLAGIVDVEHDGAGPPAVQHDARGRCRRTTRRSAWGRGWTCPASVRRRRCRDAWCRGGRAARTSRRRRRPGRRSACRRRRRVRGCSA